MRMSDPSAARFDPSHSRAPIGDATRSVLAVPASSERFIRKALASDADVLMIDLEDGVAPAQKAAARDLLHRILGDAGEARMPLWLRINAPDTDEFPADVAFVRELQADALQAVVLPMATAESLERAKSSLPGVPIAAMIETPVGVEQAVEIAADPAAACLMFGELDFLSAMFQVGAVRFSDASWVHSRLINAAAAAGCRVISGPFPDIESPRLLEERAHHDAAIGFAGKLCIHPVQVPGVNAAFAPTPEQREWAAALLAELAAMPDPGGAIRFRGQMIDAPVVACAETILALAKGLQ